MKKFIRKLIVFTLLPFFVILLLYFNDLHDYSAINFPFKRNISTRLAPKLLFEYDLKKSPSIKLLGITNDGYYFLGHKRNEIYQYIKGNNKLVLLLSTSGKFNNVLIYGNWFYIFFGDYVEKRKLSGDSLGLNARIELSFPIEKPIVIDSLTLLCRVSVDSTYAKYKFGVLSIENFEIRKIDRYLSQDIEDGGLATDGFVVKSNDSTLYSIQHYSDRIIKFNHSLDTVYSSESIDKFKKGLPVILKDTAKKSFSFGEPRRIVHLGGFANNKYLFINSVVKASNDLSSIFRNSMIIDMYNAENGKYVESFTLPNIDINQVFDIKLFDKKLYILLKKKLLVYECPEIF